MTTEERERIGELAQAGDARALDALLRECRPALTRYARTSCASEDVEDAVQDALLIVHRKFGTLRTMAALAGWLFAVARRACLRLARHRLSDRRRHAPLEEVREQAAPAVDPVLRADLARLIAALPPDQREALILRDMEGLSAEEAAARLGLSTLTFKSRLHRARARIRADFTLEPPHSVPVARARKQPRAAG